MAGLVMLVGADSIECTFLLVNWPGKATLSVVGNSHVFR
jgi:hypothetical protein